jgi:hypothetical protein
MWAVAVLAALSAAEVGTVEAHGLQVTPDLDLQANVLVESRAGEAPLLGFSTSDSRAFVAEILTPLVGLELRHPTLTFDVSYAPRLYWQAPTPPGTSGLLLLHNAALSLRALASRRVTITGTASGSIGKPDYTTLVLALGTLQGTLPDVEEIADVTGTLAVEAQLSRLWLLQVGGQIFYWDWLNAPPMMELGSTGAGGSLPLATRQTAVSLSPDALQHLTERDDFAYRVTGNYADYSDGAQILTISPTFEWRRRLARRDLLKLSAGVAYAQSLGVTASTAVRGANVFPVGGAHWEGDLARRQRTFVTGAFGASVDYYLDPVLQVAVPRATVTMRLTALVVPDWSVALAGDFATALISTPLPGNPDETAFNVTVPVRHRISSLLFGEVGLRWGDRGPLLNEPGFAFHQRQLWVYLALTGTTVQAVRWGPTGTPM